MCMVHEDLHEEQIITTISEIFTGIIRMTDLPAVKNLSLDAGYSVIQKRRTGKIIFSVVHNTKANF